MKVDRETFGHIRVRDTRTDVLYVSSTPVAIELTQIRDDRLSVGDYYEIYTKEGYTIQLRLNSDTLRPTITEEKEK